MNQPVRRHHSRANAQRTMHIQQGKLVRVQGRGRPKRHEVGVVVQQRCGVEMATERSPEREALPPAHDVAVARNAVSEVDGRWDACHNLVDVAAFQSAACDQGVRFSQYLLQNSIRRVNEPGIDFRVGED